MTIIKKFDTEEVKPNKFSKKYVVFSMFGLLSLVMLEIWVSNSTITFGEKLEVLQSTRKHLELDNQILENRIAEGSSLVTVASASASLGFSKPVSIEYIR